MDFNSCSPQTQYLLKRIVLQAFSEIAAPRDHQALRFLAKGRYLEIPRSDEFELARLAAKLKKINTVVYQGLVTDGVLNEEFHIEIASLKRHVLAANVLDFAISDEELK